MTLLYIAIAQDLLNSSSQGSQSTWSLYNPGNHGRRSLERRMNNSLEQNEKIVKANVKSGTARDHPTVGGWIGPEKEGDSRADSGYLHLRITYARAAATHFIATEPRLREPSPVESSRAKPTEKCFYLARLSSLLKEILRSPSIGTRLSLDSREILREGRGNCVNYPLISASDPRGLRSATNADPFFQEDEVVLRARSKDIEEEVKKEKEKEKEVEDEDEDEDEEDENERREIKREKDFEGLPDRMVKITSATKTPHDRCWMHAESGTDVCVLLSISTWNLANRQLKTAYPSVLANIKGFERKKKKRKKNNSKSLISSVIFTDFVLISNALGSLLRDGIFLPSVMLNTQAMYGEEEKEEEEEGTINSFVR
ncbi:hypothetical protein V1478_009666 [Vespula squamosa]|uniref:Uncharacterized protein n=1 Tax=Vespula squamosa TaxID=30214 RepID=A0ABD2AQA3_VESSQ